MWRKAGAEYQAVHRASWGQRGLSQLAVIHFVNIRLGHVLSGVCSRGWMSVQLGFPEGGLLLLFPFGRLLVILL